MNTLLTLLSNATYGGLAFVALWGAFCAVLVWRRVASTRFRNEEQQDEFLDELDSNLLHGNVESAIALCEDDRRALPQLALYAIENRNLGVNRIQRHLVERFQQDVLTDIEHRLSWVATVIKTAPMIGLFGTVVGMMGAFSNLSQGSSADPVKMAADIMFALVTTAMGLGIALPLIICMASLNVRIRKMEDLIAAGTSRLLETVRTAFGRPS